MEHHSAFVSIIEAYMLLSSISNRSGSIRTAFVLRTMYMYIAQGSGSARVGKPPMRTKSHACFIQNLQ